ncbi:MAG: Flp pilus assembly protein CpaB [Actinobacteria bacterium]|nr:Flp pilus assembly protein CpaB [Actinomycetota bacterium]
MPSLTLTPLTGLSRTVRRHRRLLAALLAAWAAYLALGIMRPDAPPHRSTVVSVHDLAAGSVVQADDIALRPWPVEGVPPGALTDPAEAAGRVAAVAVPAGTPVTTTSVVSPQALSRHMTASGRDGVAIPIRLSDPSVAALLAPGDRVDVWSSREGSVPAVAVRVAASAVVLAVPRPTSGGLLATSGASALVVLAVPPAAVPALAYATSSARLTVTVLAA